jgi:hypothetical protein
MIISHEHKFIFVKTRKTAGTSIEIALSKFCGPDDVICPIRLRRHFGGQAPLCGSAGRGGTQAYRNNLPQGNRPAWIQCLTLLCMCS